MPAPFQHQNTKRTQIPTHPHQINPLALLETNPSPESCPSRIVYKPSTSRPGLPSAGSQPVTRATLAKAFNDVDLLVLPFPGADPGSWTRNWGLPHQHYGNHYGIFDSQGVESFHIGVIMFQYIEILRYAFSP
jgi:hypothetical protein